MLAFLGCVALCFGIAGDLQLQPLAVDVTPVAYAMHQCEPARVTWIQNAKLFADFEQHDADRNGAYSWNEAKEKGIPRFVFVGTDANADGSLTFNEIMRALRWDFGEVINRCHAAEPYFAQQVELAFEVASPPSACARAWASCSW